MAVKNNIGVFYFACNVPIHVFFVEDGQMDKRLFLATWKDIPAQNEVQYTIQNVLCNAGMDIVRYRNSKIVDLNNFNFEKNLIFAEQKPWSRK